jgi:DNA-binding Xre family transcriptional regulator
MATIHEGERLKYLIENQDIKLKDVVEKLGYSNYERLYYYYNQPQIKRSTLQKFCEVLNISVDTFYNTVKNAYNYTDNLLKEDTSTTYGISKHQGKNLLSMLENRGITKTHFAKQLSISRPTLDSYFE